MMREKPLLINALENGHRGCVAAQLVELIHQLLVGYHVGDERRERVLHL